MRNLTLDLDALVVDSFSTMGDPSQWTAAAPDTFGCNSWAFCADAQAPVTDDPRCEVGVAAVLTFKECTITP